MLCCLVLAWCMCRLHLRSLTCSPHFFGAIIISHTHAVYCVSFFSSENSQISFRSSGICLSAVGWVVKITSSSFSISLSGGKVKPIDKFEETFCVLGASRHAKVVGIFSRLAIRDNKKKYLIHIPRVWRLLENMHWFCGLGYRCRCWIRAQFLTARTGTQVVGGVWESSEQTQCHCGLGCRSCS